MVNYKCVVFLFFLLPYSLPGQVEICDNGIDDDNDTLIDLNDDDCDCELIAPVSVIPNPSFEDMDCCPLDRSELDCASQWIQASEPTTDYIHNCGYGGWDDFPPPQPFPDGDGIMGFRDGRVRNNNDAEPYWKEYAGACLISPLLKDSSYRFQFDVGFVDADKSPPIDISFFGTSSCDNLPFGIDDEAFGCPTNSPDWIKLGEVRVDGGNGNKWVNTSIETVVTEDIYAIAIGPDCNPVSTPISIYYFFDNLLLANIESFDLQISEINHPCSPDYRFSIPYNPDFDYQWYLSGVALVGENTSTLSQNYGEGSYQVSILNGSSCRVSAAFEYVLPEFNSTPSITICQGESYTLGEVQLTESGTYLDTLENQNGCDSIVALELNVIGDSFDTIDVAILEGESFEVQNQSFDEMGDYPISLSTALGCDSLVLLKLSTFTIYIPNAFSPNNDGVNELFYPFSPAGTVESYTMQIYNRWGELIYDGLEWHGRDQQPGVYVYAVNINFAYGVSKSYFGSVTLVK